MKNMRLSLAAFGLLAAGLCWAPIDDRPDGAKFHSELSDGQMSKYQGGGYVKSGGSISGDQPDETPEAGTGPDSKAGSVLAGATSDSKALSTLKNAQKEVEPSPGPNIGFISMLGGLLLVLGVGAAYGVRTYLDKTVPEAPVRKKARKDS